MGVRLDRFKNPVSPNPNKTAAPSQLSDRAYCPSVGGCLHTTRQLAPPAPSAPTPIPHECGRKITHQNQSQTRSSKPPVLVSLIDRSIGGARWPPVPNKPPQKSAPRNRWASTAALRLLSLQVPTNARWMTMIDETERSEPLLGGLAVQNSHPNHGRLLGVAPPRALASIDSTHTSSCGL